MEAGDSLPHPTGLKKQSCLEDDFAKAKIGVFYFVIFNNIHNSYFCDYYYFRNLKIISRLFMK